MLKVVKVDGLSAHREDRDKNAGHLYCRARVDEEIRITHQEVKLHWVVVRQEYANSDEMYYENDGHKQWVTKSAALVVRPALEQRETDGIEVSVGPFDGQRRRQKLSGHKWTQHLS